MDNQIDDIEIRFNEPSEPTIELLEAGAYMAKLIGFKVADKPQWKQDDEQKKYPKKQIDPKQWEWQFQLTDEGYEDVIMTDWTSRTFGRPDSTQKATARIYAALLLGKEDLDGTENMSTRQLIGKPIELWLTKTEKRNYISAPKCRFIAPRQRPQRPTAPPTATQKPAVGRVTIPALENPTWADDKDDIPFD